MSEIGKTAQARAHVQCAIRANAVRARSTTACRSAPLPATRIRRACSTPSSKPGVDAVIVNPGMLVRHGHRFAGGPAVILRIDQTTMWRHGTETGYADTHNRLVASVEEAVQMGAEAVITYLFTCNNRPEEETRSFEICRAGGQRMPEMGHRACHRGDGRQGRVRPP